MSTDAAAATAAAERQKTQLRDKINAGQAQCESLKQDLAQLQRERDEALQARCELVSMMDRREAAFASIMSRVNGSNLAGNAAESFLAGLTDQFAGRQKAQLDEQLQQAKSALDARIAQMEQEIEVKKCSLSAAESNLNTCRASLASIR